ncbi:EAL domain-containing protein [Enterobacter sp. Bisph1]|uniref:EAL domain-containing protein n=1 Tax=Enterobacter sp. Bisph1 TaxID=1274399 RepID=UPI00057C21E4|nr:EAL domain-containing protein [Enterobacter sp. Bisph1]
MKQSIYNVVRKFILALMLCLVAIPVSRIISPRTLIETNEVYLAWLPISVMLAVLLLFGRHGIAPIILGCGWVNEVRFHLPYHEAAVLLGCQLFSVLLCCGIVRWQLGSRWRYGLPNKNMGVRILWLGFIAPMGIKASMYIAGAWYHYPVNLTLFFGNASVIYSIIDIQSLICAALIFTLLVYYPLRMILHPRFARTLWRKSVKPCFSSNKRLFTLGWFLSLSITVIILCSPYKSAYFAGYLVPVTFIIFTLGISKLSPSLVSISWGVSTFMLLTHNINLFYGARSDYSLAFVMSVLICFTVCMLYMMRVFHRSEWLKTRWQAQAMSDPLTHLPNLRALEKQVEQQPNAIMCCLHMKNLEFLSRHFGMMMRVHVKRSVTRELQPMLHKGEQFFQLPGSELLLLLEGPEIVARLQHMVNYLNSRRIFWNKGALDIEFGISWGEMQGAGAQLHPMLGQLSWLSEQASAQQQVLALTNSRQVVTHQTTDRVLLLNKVKRALDENGIVLYGQPIVDAQGQGYQEILTRLRVDDELIPPNLFIPVIAQFNLGARFDMQVTECLLAWMQAHPGQGEGARFSVNLMPLSLMQNEFAAQWLALFARFAVSPREVIIEITEEQAFSHSEASIYNIQQLRNAGFKIAIDDFGTGYANFERLKELQADIIKIDGCFVRDILQDPQDAMIVKAICELAKPRSMTVVAEYVENEAQRALLLGAGVDYLQGYLSGKPQPLA